MIRYYFKYTPARRGLTGAEFIAEFIDNTFDNVRWIEVYAENNIHYGYLESEDSDNLAKAITAIEGKFSAARLLFEEFIGAIYLLYNPIQIEPRLNENDEAKTLSFSDFMKNYNIEITEEQAFNYAKQYKKRLFKELLKKYFEDYNDLIADNVKLIMLLAVYKDILSEQEKQIVNQYIEALKIIYPKENCMKSVQRTITNMAKVGPIYYQKVAELEQASTKDDLINVKFEIPNE